MSDKLEVAKAVLDSDLVKEAYTDLAKPSTKTIGEIAGLVTRAIKVKLSGLEKWVLNGEYAMKQVQMELERKLQSVPVENIVSPDVHVAVPALQYISYSMDNEDLREMYANLLANSMNKVVKAGVHPGFVEIIKQLSPDEAKVLKELKKLNQIPTVTVKYKAKSGGTVSVFNDFSDIALKCSCSNTIETCVIFDNLERLGLVSRPFGVYIKNDAVYSNLENHSIIKGLIQPEIVEIGGYIDSKIEKGKVELTEFGKKFCKICIG